MMAMAHKFLLILMLVGLSSMAMAADDKNSKSPPLQGEDLKEAVQLNDIYARHLYGVICMERQKNYFLPPILSPEERATRLASYKVSCDCQTDYVLKTVKPNDLIGYVTAMHGSEIPDERLPAGTQREKLDPQTKALYAKIMYVNQDKDVRRKCGFKQ